MKCKFCQGEMTEVEQRPGSFVCVKCGARARLVWDEPDATDIIEQIRRRVAPILPQPEPFVPHPRPWPPGTYAYAAPFPPDGYDPWRGPTITGTTIVPVYACPVSAEDAAKIITRISETKGTSE